jgi:hypothetical protein
MTVPRWAAGGVAIVLVGNVLWSAATPDLHRDNPEHATRQELRERQWLEEERQRRLRVELPSRVEAELAEEARSAEVRAADAAARRAVRSMTRLVP